MFFLKLLLWNVLHTFGVGFLSLLAASPGVVLQWARGGRMDEEAPGWVMVLPMVLMALVSPVVVLLPWVSTLAYHMNGGGFWNALGVVVAGWWPYGLAKARPEEREGKGPAVVALALTVVLVAGLVWRLPMWDWMGRLGWWIAH